LEFWKPKLEENSRRDKANQKALRRMGWRIMVVWECELGDRERLALKMQKFLESDC
jgi:DNA mismatch endonuclease (patch repair protein)